MINLLEQNLKKIDLRLYGKDLPRDKGTKILTSSIENFAREQKFECEKEVFLGLTRETNGYKGLIDIIIKSPNGNQYAIEIDSSNKKWSLEKLLDAYKKGYAPIWVRWCSKIKINIPTVINLIDLTNK